VTTAPNSEAIQADLAYLPDGMLVKGEFVKHAVQEDRVDKQTGVKYAGRHVVSILADDRVVQVEYRDEDAVVAAIGRPERGDRVVVSIGQRVAKGFVFNFGRRVN
jgi:hypothetical protein